MTRVKTQVIVLNGGSSSGKSGFARCLQAVLPGPWLGADTMVDAIPAALQHSETGIAFGPDGGVGIGPEFREPEDAWTEGVAAMARAGARDIAATWRPTPPPPSRWCARGRSPGT